MFQRNINLFISMCMEEVLLCFTEGKNFIAAGLHFCGSKLFIKIISHENLVLYGTQSKSPEMVQQFSLTGDFAK